ncbi:type II toxin-antitoxin system VapC family toxin [Methylobacterium organophilum]|uniref:Ribonuclease VapC n=1 Tax=Methylobacterium organophilum TaxID=410 RepID=A0ABQ4TGY7_METOR|nr:type II toxin-antitoxin system VapC family toxin [Methylobacterium organophilum]GJE29612.1 Ribonuclease VapC [Methylobacterium organophilum]
MSDCHVIDTSVFIAILANEADADLLSEAVRSRPRRVMSAATYLECAMVIGRWQAARADLDAWLAREQIDIHPVDHALVRLAADAFARFGKGRHPAGLNFGDCFSYALAKSLDAPLLFKGADFARTDIAPALP